MCWIYLCVVLKSVWLGSKPISIHVSCHLTDIYCQPTRESCWNYDGQKKPTQPQPQKAVFLWEKRDTKQSPHKYKIITEGRVTIERSRGPQGHIVVVVPGQWMTVMSGWRGGAWGKQEKLSSGGNSIWKVPVAGRSMAPLTSFLAAIFLTCP